ncbi:MAG TPA: hypothetical protein VL084_06995 [Thermoanaerobaculia bacterium]|nr:hypothetical protein [Thermoanaerobaculia bacterium]
MEHLQRDIQNAFERLADAFVSVIPAALVLLTALLVGVLVGVLLRSLLGLVSRLVLKGRGSQGSLPDRFLRAAGFEAGFERAGRAVSFWVGVVVGLAVGVNALEPGALRNILGGVLAYLPRLLAAGLVFLVGFGVAAIVRRSVLLGAVNAGLPWARLGARGIHLVLLAFFATMALDHLGVASNILVAAFSILAGGLVFALALAFGLGARDAARRYIEKKLRAEEEDTGIRHV